MTKYILLGGLIRKAEDGGKAFCEELTKDISHKPVRILNCLFARDEKDWESVHEENRKFLERNISDFEVELALPEKFVEQMKNADIIFFQGGIPEKLISQLNTFSDWKKELEQKVVAASSSGADALCKYYASGKTQTIKEGLGILDIKFIPHWKSDYGEGLVIEWDSLLTKLQAHRESLNVLTVRDTEFVVIEK